MPSRLAANVDIRVTAITTAITAAGTPMATVAQIGYSTERARLVRASSSNTHPTKPPGGFTR